MAFALWLALDALAAAEWRADIIEAPGRVTAVEIVGADVRIAIGRSWYRITTETARLESAPPPHRPELPIGALPDGRVAIGIDKVALSWLADPTNRYRHGVLGDVIEAGSLVIERRDRSRGILRLGNDAVFEDLEPRVSKIGVSRGSSSSNLISTAVQHLPLSTRTPRRSLPRRRLLATPTPGSTLQELPILTAMAPPTLPWSASLMSSADWSSGHG